MLRLSTLIAGLTLSASAFALSLADLTDPDTLRAMARKTTGGKAIIETFG